ncbi:ABC transporter permease [Streptacidiphilus jiangxiensis]|uniref:Peptide/nickel transport system permease protein n=1 Tax=Streptacidiphilus jiangxiensis TaxID=235985 RepID=A0A1H7WQS1_STRJI|nr:ABC transporter permease [Streptacidiphilus jiangxiensis]SEM23359.1 peptide/nickel transport system permease protein [Streptacidiphilus jiangxiensis]
MIRFLLRRLLGAAAVLLALAALTYLLFYAMPGDPAQLACGKSCTSDQLAQVRHALGTDQPLARQFWTFLTTLVLGHGFSTGPSTVWCSAPCLGYSYQSNEPVTQMLVERLPVDVSLALGSAALWLLIGVGTGLFAALRPGRWRDRVTNTVVLTLGSTPVFVMALLLLMGACVWLQVLPFPNYVPLTDDPAQWAQNLLLPWLAIALVSAAGYTRLTRAGVLETLNQDHIRTLRAYGYPERRIVLRHAVRGALPTVVTVAAMDIGMVLAGAVFTETMFGLPGLGKLAVESASTVDLPVVCGITLLAGALIVVANTAADLLHAALDPRVRI